MKTCTGCGKEVQDEANFCNICGGSVFSAPPAEAPPPEPVVLPELPLPDSDAYYTDTGSVPAPIRTYSRPVLAIAAGLVALAVAAAILSNPVRRFLGAVAEGDTLRAEEIYADSLADSEKRLARAAGGLDTYVGQVLEQYLNSQISYESLCERLAAVEVTGIAPETLPEVQEYAAQVDDYRRTFESAEAAFAQGDYAAALPLYERAAEFDAFYGADVAGKLETAAEYYRSDVLAQAESMVSEERFTDAFALLKEAMDLLPGDEVLKNTYAACVETHYVHTVNHIAEEVAFLCQQNEHMFALTYLDGMLSDYPDEPRLLEAREDCLVSFEEYTYKEAHALALAGEYAQAAELTATGLSVFESESVRELQSICLSHLPVKLGDMPIAVNDTVGGTWNTYTNKTDEYLEDHHNNVYSHSLSVGRGTLTYQVDGLYQRFTGIVSFPKGMVANSSRRSATLTISGDGTTLAVFKNFTGTSLPTAFDLDISGYQQITLKWECKGYNEWKDWGFFATVFDGVLTPIPRDLNEGVG